MNGWMPRCFWLLLWPSSREPPATGAYGQSKLCAVSQGPGRHSNTAGPGLRPVESARQGRTPQRFHPSRGVILSVLRSQTVAPPLHRALWNVTIVICTTPRRTPVRPVGANTASHGDRHSIWVSLRAVRHTMRQVHSPTRIRSANTPVTAKRTTPLTAASVTERSTSLSPMRALPRLLSGR